MKVALVSSEVVPFAKTGGLADVCGALPIELEKTGNEIVVFMPEYRATQKHADSITETNIHIPIPIGRKTVSGQLLKSQLPDSNVVLYLVRQPDYFDRDGIYQSEHGDFPDNCERFIFFCRFVLEAFRHLDWYPSLIHCNDWQTGLIPAYLKTSYADQPNFDSITSLITIHNLAYQGMFSHQDMLLTGIDHEYFNWKQMEFYGHLNLLKTGIVFADSLSTVSPTYAKEIQTAEQGCGLENVLQGRSDVLCGVLNGIDTAVWNPETDKHIAENYSVTNWQKGKAACKRALQQELSIETDAEIPLIGVVGRLASQKGWSLIIHLMHEFLEKGHKVQWAILGTGDEQFETALRHLRQRAAGYVGVNIGFSDQLAHRIEAGADMFLMPSRYEPCGLNQQYSLQYGTIPIVHATGGLADTVVHANPQSLENKSANGFTFQNFDTNSFRQALYQALHTYTEKSIWQQLVETGMNHDWSWTGSAAAYQKLYQQTVDAGRRNVQPA